jgi:DNA-binding NarL/FixJ family response regulator
MAGVTLAIRRAGVGFVLHAGDYSDCFIRRVAGTMLPVVAAASIMRTAARGGRMSRILIADDHAVVRAGLRQFLLEDPRLSRIEEVSSGEEALDLLRTASFDLLILDINMPGRNGLDVLKHIHVTHPEVRVLVVSGFPERQYAVNVLKAGAGGYLCKECAPEELLKAVRTVLAGRRYVSSTLAEQLVNNLDVDNELPMHSNLSEREFQVLCKLAMGKAVSDIARELCLSVKTVSTYRTRVLEKMNFRSNADITTYALRSGLMQ